MVSAMIQYISQYTGRVAAVPQGAAESALRLKTIRATGSQQIAKRYENNALPTRYWEPAPHDVSRGVAKVEMFFEE